MIRRGVGVRSRLCGMVCMNLLTITEAHYPDRADQSILHGSCRHTTPQQKENKIKINFVIDFQLRYRKLL